MDDHHFTKRVRLAHYQSFTDLCKLREMVNGIRRKLLKPVRDAASEDSADNVGGRHKHRENGEETTQSLTQWMCPVAVARA